MSDQYRLVCLQHGSINPEPLNAEEIGTLAIQHREEFHDGIIPTTGIDDYLIAEEFLAS